MEQIEIRVEQTRAEFVWIEDVGTREMRGAEMLVGSYRVVATLILCVSLSGIAGAEPEGQTLQIVHGDVSYVVDNTRIPGGRYIKALDRSQRLLWELKIHDSRLASDQDSVPIVSLEITREQLVLSDERESVYHVSLAERSVALKEAFVVEAYVCEEDQSCLNTCMQGAVNRDWYEVHRQMLAACDDGCADDFSGPPRCIDGQCVSFREDGRTRETCTARKIRFE